jgi:hypothetical protein
MAAKKIAFQRGFLDCRVKPGNDSFVHGMTEKLEPDRRGSRPAVQARAPQKKDGYRRFHLKLSESFYGLRAKLLFMTTLYPPTAGS